MVVAAVISLQDSLGSGPDEICTWIEVYGYLIALRQNLTCSAYHIVSS